MEKESKIPTEEERILRELISSLEKDNLKLKQEITKKEKVILKLEEELKSSHDVFKKFDKGKEKLDNILIKGRRSCNRQGIDYSKNLNNKTRPRQRSSQFQVCHYCSAYGHIRPLCYKLLRDWRWSGSQMLSKPPSNCVWMKKKLSLYAAHAARKSSSDGTWYFDRGCSRHMIGNAGNLTDIHREDGGQVTFGDGAKGAVIGRGRLKVDGLPKLENVLLVNGLKANLLSISQLCDQNLHVRGILKLLKYGAVRGLPAISSKTEAVCKGSMAGKQHRTPHSAVKIITAQRPLELLHIDLMGPVQTESIAGKWYVLVCVDNFSRFTWVEFIREKSDTYKVFASLCKRLMTEKNVVIGRIIRIRSDHGREFENNQFAQFCEKKGISHEFFAPKTPQQNGVAERKNKTLQEMARAMINSKNLPHKLWAEAVNTTCYISNRVHLRYLTHKTPYELWKGRKPKVHYFREFGSTCYVLRDREQLGKFDSRSIEETVNVEIADQNKNLPLLDDEESSMSRGPIEKTSTNLNAQPSEQAESHTLGEGSLVSDDEVEEIHENIAEIGPETEKAPSMRVQKNHPLDAVIGDINGGMKTRGRKQNYSEMVRFVCYTSALEPRRVEDALKDEFWIRAMQEELEQFDRNKVWTLVPRPANINVIGTKWVFKKKTDEEGNVVRNKARLVAQGYTQVEGVDFYETFAPVARLESIRLSLVVASSLKIKLHKMDVKSAFLNGYLAEEVYVEQPKGFVRGGVDKTLFIRKEGIVLTIAQVYVDDIIFGSTVDSAQK
ncbi:hypothetical protein H6P81_006385 [Aristolochia fimbriata]|uniref:Integrase catalytic domain-containing protein n=1 Tax=Aristolochia fimbriata TaxID=158543 RepID=A0AAV7F0V8_ARIFI|nr:hypothetical protein H6P81_006385 [Aristolochia fimbriata]